MTVERVKCAECDNLSLPQTAAANGGLCAPCAKIPEALRRAGRDYESTLLSGELFRPSQAERAGARRPSEFGDPAAAWRPEPDYYKDDGIQSVREVIDLAANRPAGHAFLVSNRDGLLSLAFNETFGVCEYRNDETGDNLYAYTPQNLTQQVDADRHLIQACSCCGVGLLWYPSRFHMPKASAFAIFSAFALGGAAADTNLAEWLDCGDISYTARGRG